MPPRLAGGFGGARGSRSRGLGRLRRGRRQASRLDGAARAPFRAAVRGVFVQSVGLAFGAVRIRLRLVMIDAYVAFRARLKPNAFALITPRRWATYAELNADTDRFAAGLRELGVAPERGVVSIRIANDYLTHVVFLALARLGVVSSPGDDPAPT